MIQVELKIRNYILTFETQQHFIFKVYLLMIMQMAAVSI